MEINTCVHGTPVLVVTAPEGGCICLWLCLVPKDELLLIYERSFFTLFSVFEEREWTEKCVCRIHEHLWDWQTVNSHVGHGCAGITWERLSYLS